jgi:hypothetical protein
LYLAVPQSHECGNRESCCRGLREKAENALDLLQRVGIRFLRFCCLWIDSRITGGVFTLEIILLLCQREDSADYAFDVFQSIAAELACANLIEPTLNVICSRVF